jgi:hypothetical protein
VSQVRLQLFDGDIFDEAIFDVDAWGWIGSDTGDTARGQMLRGRRKRRKIIDYETPILKNVRG